MTWRDVQKKLIEVQQVHQMCIHKKELTELGEFKEFKSEFVQELDRSLSSHFCHIILTFLNTKQKFIESANKPSKILFVRFIL